MERSLVMEAYFNPFKNIIVFKKLIDHLRSFPVALKNDDWGSEGYGSYKKIERDGAWHAKFEASTLSRRKFIRSFKTKEKKRKLSGKFTSDDILKFNNFLDLREAKRAIHFDLQPGTYEYLKWSRLSAGEKNVYNETLSKLQVRQIKVPRLVNWNIFADYDCEDDLLDMMKIEYMHNDGDVFKDHSWENVFSNGEKVYRVWCLEFYLTMYFNRKVDRNEIMRKKCIWFRLCKKEHVYTLSEFTVLLGLYSEIDVQHQLFETYFLRLMINDEGFNHEAYWSRIRQPRTGKKKLTDIRYPLLHIMHKILVRAFMHRSRSIDKLQKPDLWLLSLLDEGHNANVAWILAEYIFKRALSIKESSEIYEGHFVTRLQES
uniref:Uncharacterized protein n=1 Tax=Tanacetum cinerariifolium TaxID=118510 RepID=A0A6L2K2D7_TANCI|nr:hypothetical protein [Tanacetum cinerariifolium]